MENSHSEPAREESGLGFFYGERQRARLDYWSTWVALEELGPWPSVVFEKRSHPGEVTTKRVAFSPIALVIGAFQDGDAAVLVGAARALRAKCEAALGS